MRRLRRRQHAPGAQCRVGVAACPGLARASAVVKTAAVLWLLIGTFLVICVAGIGQAVSGFGFMLIAVPLLTLLMGPREAVPIGLAIGQAIALLGWYEGRAEVDWQPIRLLVVGSLVGLPLGLLVFRLVPLGLLQVLIGAVVIGLTLLLVIKIALPSSRASLLGTGGVSGVLLGASGMPGPVLVVALQTVGLPPRRFRSTLQALLSIVGFAALGAFLLSGSYSLDSLWLFLAGLPATWVGWRIGDLIFARLDHRTLRIVVLVTLFLSGASTLLRGLGVF